MHTWISLLSRESAMLIVLVALGSGPVAFIHREVETAIRAALAPAYGLAVGLCVMMTVLWRVPANRSWWVLILLALVSVAVAAWASRRNRSEAAARSVRRIDMWSVVQLTTVVVVVLFAFNRPLATESSVGPVGYSIGDASGYVETQDGARTESLHTAAEHIAPPYADLALGLYREYAAGYPELGFDALAANVDAILGLGGTETYSPFLIALLATTGLGLFAGVRLVSGRRTWAAVLAGCLAAGPFWLELFMEGSEGAITGLALLVPLCLAGYMALRCRRRTDYVLFALLAAGLQTAYPLFVPAAAIAVAVVLFVLTLRHLRRGSQLRVMLRSGGVSLLGVLFLAIAFTPVAFARNVRYWHAILTGAQSFAGLPSYDIPAGLLPSYLLQTRNLYVLPQSLEAGPLIASILIPGAMIAVIYVTLRHRPLALGGAAIVGAATFLAYYVLHHDHCTYCEQRNFLVVTPLLTVAFGVGISILAIGHSFGSRVAAVGIGIAALLGVAQQTRIEDRILTQAAYYFEPDTRAVLSRVPRLRAGALAIEGFAATPKPWMEEALVYDAAREVAGSPPSIIDQTSVNGSLDYILGPQPPGPQFDPAYRFVLTRLGGVATQRRTLYRAGPVALQRRVDKLDVLVAGGVAVAFARTDPRGEAWIEGPLTLSVSGTRTGQRVWVDVEAEVTSSATVSAQPGMEVRRRGSRIDVCLRTSGPGPVRAVTINFIVALVAEAPPPGQVFGVAPPPEALRLVSTRASTNKCS